MQSRESSDPADRKAELLVWFVENERFGGRIDHYQIFEMETELQYFWDNNRA
jgi:hypothetical protein